MSDVGIDSLFTRLVNEGKVRVFSPSIALKLYESLQKAGLDGHVHGFDGGAVWEVILKRPSQQQTRKDREEVV